MHYSASNFLTIYPRIPYLKVILSNLTYQFSFQKNALNQLKFEKLATHLKATSFLGPSNTTKEIFFRIKTYHL